MSSLLVENALSDEFPTASGLKAAIIGPCNPRSNRSLEQYFCKVVAWVLECWCVGFIVIAAPPNWKPSLGSETHLPHPWWSTMTMKMIAESAKWCSRQMAGISAKFSHITLGTIFGTFQPATVGCCQKVQPCAQIPTIPTAFCDPQKVAENLGFYDHNEPALPDKERAEWSTIAVPQYWPIGVFLDCQIIFSSIARLYFLTNWFLVSSLLLLLLFSWNWLQN